MRLEEIMTKAVLTLSAEMLASDAYAWMCDAGVRHAPVMDGQNEIVGIVSDRDLGGPRGGAMRVGHRLGDLMHRDPVVAAASLSVVEAVKMMRTHRIGCLPVVEMARSGSPQGKVTGIVTRTDLLLALAKIRRERRRTSPSSTSVDRAPYVVSPNRDKHL